MAVVVVAGEVGEQKGVEILVVGRVGFVVAGRKSS